MKKIKTKLDWPHIGNEHINDFLEKSLGNNQISNTYIFNGPDSLGKNTVAHFFAKIIFCLDKKDIKPCGKCPACLSLKDGEEKISVSSYVDFFELKPEADKKNISIEQVRSFIRNFSMSSFRDSYRVGIIKQADLLSKNAANALLKTLEEPHKKNIIILITEDYSFLPLTIISRSQLLSFRPVKADLIYDYLIKEKKASRSQAKNFARLSLGRPALAVKFFEDKDYFKIYKIRANVFIDFFNNDINDRFYLLEQIMGSQMKGQEAVWQVKKIVWIWQGILRDIIFSGMNLDNLIQHEIFKKEISNIKNRIKKEGFLRILKILQQAEEDINTNVNPRLVLENIAIQI